VGIAMVGLFAELITFFTSSSIGLPGRLGIWLMIILAIDISLTQLPSRVTLDNEDALNQQNIGL
jgi:hypothetical protein